MEIINTTNKELTGIYSEIIDKENIVVVDDFFSKEYVLIFRNKIFEFFRKTKQLKDIDYKNISSLDNMNFWKLERGVSKMQKSLHSFFSYFINCPEILLDELRKDFEYISDKLTNFHAEITHSRNPKANTKYRPQLIQYHKGGGFFSPHYHSLEPMKIGVILSLSEAGIDYHTGGNGFENSKGEFVSLSNEMKPGSLCLFKYSLKHWVEPTDIDQPFSDSNDGRWSMVIPIY